MAPSEGATVPDMLGDYWDALVLEAATEPLPQLEQHLVEVLHILVQRDDAQAPAPDFVADLEQRLLADAAILSQARGLDRYASGGSDAQPAHPILLSDSPPALRRHGRIGPDELYSARDVVTPDAVPWDVPLETDPVRHRAAPRAVATALGMAALLLITLGAVAAIALLHQRPIARGTGPATIPALQSNPVQFLWESRGVPALGTLRGGRDVVTPMKAPYHIAIDPNGTIWVPESWDNQFRLLAPDGSLLRIWGEKGTAPGKFNFVNVQAFSENGTGAAVFDAAGNLYVADAGNYRVQVFAPDLQFIRAWGTKGEGDGQFIGLKDLAVGADGNVYTLDAARNLVQVFSQDGEYLRSWGAQGVADGEFLSPYGIAIDPAGNVFVADTGNHRIQKFTPEGMFLSAWGHMGTGDAMFRQPDDVAIDAQGRIYVTDTSNNRVEILDANGMFLAAFGTRGSEPGQFIAPTGIALDNAGNVYITEGGNERIQKFRLLPPFGG